MFSAFRIFALSGRRYDPDFLSGKIEVFQTVVAALCLSANIRAGENSSPEERRVRTWIQANSRDFYVPELGVGLEPAMLEI